MTDNMVSNFGGQPILSRFTKKWDASKEAIDENCISPVVSASDAVPTSSPRSVAVQAHNDDGDISFLRIPEINDRQKQRLPRRDSGSKLIYWGEKDHAERSSSLGSLCFSERREEPAFFGQKPTFTDFNNKKCLKHDTRKILNGYLRHLSTALETKNLALNRRGTCYFYVDKFLMQLEAPQAGDSVTMSTVVQRRLPGMDARDSDESSQASTQCSLQEDKDVNKILGQNMSLRLRRKNQVVLCCSQRLAINYENFAVNLDDFVKVASEVKAFLKLQAESEYL